MYSRTRRGQQISDNETATMALLDRFARPLRSLRVSVEYLKKKDYLQMK
jgi:hypothetical protein